MTTDTKQNENPPGSAHTQQMLVGAGVTVLAVLAGAFAGAFCGNAAAEAFGWDQSGDVVLASLGAWLGVVAGAWLTSMATTGATRDGVRAVVKIIAPVVTCMIGGAILGQWIDGEDGRRNLGGLGIAIGTLFFFMFSNTPNKSGNGRQTKTPDPEST